VIESALVVGTLLLLTAGSLAWAALSPATLLVAAFGLPTGLVYHVELRRSLLRTGRLPRRWWLHPTAHHRGVAPDDAPRVLAWCRAGALGCGVVFLGCAVAALGAWKAAP
jgi:hypothetical protein